MIVHQQMLEAMIHFAALQKHNIVNQLYSYMKLKIQLKKHIYEMIVYCNNHHLACWGPYCMFITGLLP